MSFTVNRVPFGGGGVPSIRAPMSSIFSPTGMSAGVRSVHQIRVETPPGFEIRLLDAVASVRTFAVRSAPCPVTTRRTGGESVIVSLAVAPTLPLRLATTRRDNEIISTTFFGLPPYTRRRVNRQHPSGSGTGSLRPIFGYTLGVGHHNDLFHVPKVIIDVRGHRRADSQARVLTAKVV